MFALEKYKPVVISNIQRFKNNIYMKNGFYIPVIHLFLYLISKDLFLSTIISLKLYSGNYFLMFEHLYDYLPHPYNSIKQFIRFTDTGHIASMIYYFRPSFFPIAFNIHFIITFGYWFAVSQLQMKDADDVDDPEIIPWFQNIWTCSNHGLPLLLFINELRSNISCNHYFTGSDVYYTYMWIYAWFIFIYLPWRYITKDPVYSLLAETTSLKHKTITITMVHTLCLLSNITGYLMVRFIFRPMQVCDTTVCAGN
jgi:hypothetical protein